jgi:uncharacterized protein
LNGVEEQKHMLETPKRSFRLRPWVRAFHRDIGYFVVGLTFIYALSGLAVNHIGQWDPNFKQVEKHHQLPDVAALPKDDAALTATVLKALAITETPSDSYRSSEQQLDIVLDQRTLHVDAATGKVFEEGEEPRFLLRVFNWLHLNRGKRAWTYVADAYAVLLLFLATSGLVMIPGKKGLIGRGAIFALAGAAIPTLYVLLSGGP